MFLCRVQRRRLTTKPNARQCVPSSPRHGFQAAWTIRPDQALVRATVIRAHCRNVNENKLTHLFVRLKAVFSGEKPALGESGEVVLGSGFKTE